MRRSISVLAVASVFAAGLWFGGSLPVGSGGDRAEYCACAGSSNSTDVSQTELAPQATLVGAPRLAGYNGFTRPALAFLDDAPSPRPPAFQRPLRI
jgi:hypothetical protein